MHLKNDPQNFKNDLLSQNPLSHDPELAQMLEAETCRQQDGIELIASENYASPAVRAAQGSFLTNKYAEGYPGKRYYGGCEFVDQVENLAIARACQLFGSESANVQPHSGSGANMAVYSLVLKPGDALLGMSLAAGGHLTHGSAVNFSGRLYRPLSYHLHPETHRLDFDQIREQVRRDRPQLLVAGASAYPRLIDFASFGAIAKEFGIPLLADVAHIAGLIAVGLHPSPLPHANFVTSTTHKTLRGPRGGLILCGEADLKKINSMIFPGLQGGPLMHVIAGKAVAFGEALKPEFTTYQKAVLSNAQILATKLLEKGFTLVTGGTENHLLLIDLTGFADGDISGKQADLWLDQAGITVNKNAVPGEKRSFFVTSGIRLGTPAVTTRGFRAAEMQLIAQWIDQALRSRGDAKTLANIREAVIELCKSFPLS